MSLDDFSAKVTVTPEQEALVTPSAWAKECELVVTFDEAVYVTPARIKIPWEKRTSNVLTLELVGYDPVFSDSKVLPRYKRMVTWKLVEPLLTPHKRYPCKITSRLVWKSIASTGPL